MSVDHKLVYILITDDTYQISVFYFLQMKQPQHLLQLHYFNLCLCRKTKQKKKATKQPYNQNATMIITTHIYSLFYCSMLYEHAHFIDMHLFIYSLNCPLLAYSLLKNFNSTAWVWLLLSNIHASFIYQMAENKWNFQLDDVCVSLWQLQTRHLYRIGLHTVSGLLKHR